MFPIECAVLISVFIAAKTAELHPANWSRPLYNYYQHLMANNWYEISGLTTMNGGNIWEEPEVHQVSSRWLRTCPEWSYSLPIALNYSPEKISTIQSQFSNVCIVYGSKRAMRTSVLHLKQKVGRNLINVIESASKSKLLFHQYYWNLIV